MEILKQNKAFTLVELIIIIAILGILTSICIPKNKIRDYRLNTKVKELTSDIRMIRYLRMTEGENYSILIQEHYYVIYKETSPIREVKLDKDIYLSDNFGQRMIFSPNGSPKRGGKITIIDEITKSEYNITVVPFTGRVLLQ